MGAEYIADAVIPEAVLMPLPLDGVYFQPLKIIQTPAGDVLHGLRQDYRLAPDLNSGFGELYFSEILAGRIKGWKKHTTQTQLYMIPYGQVKIVLYDDRPESATKGQIMTIITGRPDKYGLLKIPAGIWYSFAAFNCSSALICNYADIPHDPAEAMTLPLTTESIPYKWDMDSLKSV